MRIAHISDLHVTEGPRLADQDAALQAAASEAAAADCQVALVTGDLAGHTVPHRMTLAERLVLQRFICGLADRCPVYVLRGNHDDERDLETLAAWRGQYPVVPLVGAGVLADAPHRDGSFDLLWLAYPTRGWVLRQLPDTAGARDADRATEEALGRLMLTWRLSLEARTAVQARVVIAHGMVRGGTTDGGEVISATEPHLPGTALEELPVDYIALGHLHAQQRAGRRAWYAGAPYCTSHGERWQGKGWLLADVRGPGTGPTPAHEADPVQRYPALENTDGAQGRRVRVWHQPGHGRPWLTLEYAWEAGSWVGDPLADAWNAVEGADVRMRLRVRQEEADACPWAAEQARVLAAGAARVQAERIVEPTVRVRAPALAQAATLEDKLVAYWSTLEDPPPADAQAAARANLALLREAEPTAIIARITGKEPTR